jgi:YbbR domain-containing protein
MVITVDKWLNHPTAAKLIALALAILMWAVVHFDPDTTPNNVSSLVETKVINGIKIQAYGLDERNYVLKSIDPQTVKLKVSGSKSDILAATAKTDSYEVQVDLRTVGEGKHTMKLQYDLPRGLQFVEMSPASVTVTIEAIETKEFEVAIETKGNTATGYKAGTPIVKPSNRVHVTLPSSEMDKVERVGATISVEGAKEVIKNKSVKLVAYDKAGKVIENVVIEPALLEIEIPITYPFKAVPLQFVLVGRIPTGLSIASFKPDVEQVTVYGPQEALDKLEFLEVDVQLAEVKNSGKITVPLIVTAPIIEISPKQIEVNIDIVLSSTRLLEGLPITWSGLGEGLTVTIVEPSTGKADITIQGAPAILDRLQPGDVNVIADLSGRGPGMHTVPLIVNLERFMEQTGGTNSITVEIANDVPVTAPEDEVEIDDTTEEEVDNSTTEPVVP